jgi:hypothetical protein
MHNRKEPEGFMQFGKPTFLKSKQLSTYLYSYEIKSEAWAEDPLILYGKYSPTIWIIAKLRRGE